MSARVTISLPQSLVDDIDRYAAHAGLSRSSLVREASSAYLTQASAREAAERRREGAEGFLAFLEETSRLPALDDRPVLEILRELRGPLDAAPRVPGSDSSR